MSYSWKCFMHPVAKSDGGHHAVAFLAYKKWGLFLDQHKCVERLEEQF